MFEALSNFWSSLSSPLFLEENKIWQLISWAGGLRTILKEGLGFLKKIKALGRTDHFFGVHTQEERRKKRYKSYVERLLAMERRNGKEWQNVLDHFVFWSYGF